MARHLDTNGPRSGILSDGTRVTVYHQPGVADAWTAVLEGGDWEEQAHGNMLPMLAIGERPENFSQFTEGQKGRHLGTQVPWQAVPAHIREHIELRAAPERMASNGRTSAVDEVALRELDLYISNTYELVAAPNSIGKSIDTNLRRKLEKGTYEPALAPKAWLHLADEGAKRYTREFGSDSPIFNAATRRALAESLARAWEEENAAEMRRNAAPMSAAELARYAARESVRSTERFGLNQEGIERAYVVGHDDIRGAGGRAAVLSALRAIASDRELVTEHGYTEFWGRITTGSGEPGGDSWRVVVVPEMTRNGRTIPSYLEGYEDFTNEDFYNDLRGKGYSHAQARLHAKQASYRIGKIDFLPPRVPKGWTLFREPIMRRRDAKVAFVAHKGTKFVVYDQTGKAISPELRRIRGLIEWQEAHGWKDP